MKRTDILAKKLTLEVLEDLFKVLDDKEECTNKTWGFTGNMIPKTKWDDDLRTRVNVIDEETGEVVMVEEYDYIPKKKEDYTEEDKAMLKAIDNVKTALEKLI